MTEFTRLSLAVAGLILYQIIFYFGSEKFQKNPHNVLTGPDQYIPFWPASVLVYSLWFPEIVVFPYVLFYFSPNTFAVYMTGMILDIGASVVIYLLYPTSFTRPVPPDTVTGRLMKAVYKGSYRGLNCAPSLHCSSCMMILLCLWSGGTIPAVVSLGFAVVSVGIILSTMTTKQHALVDFLTAIPMAVISFGFGLKFPLLPLVHWILR